VVAVVGENMHGIPGMAGRTFAALGRENVNIIAIAQGSSEYNISFIVEAGAMQRAMTTLHKEFRLHEAAAGESGPLPSNATSPVTSTGTTALSSLKSETISAD
jgi:ACT domain-containing protein